MGTASGEKTPLGLSAIALPAALFGLHTFILMSTGTQGDTALADGDVNELLYNMREGLQLIGFLLYGILSWRSPRALSAETERILRVLLAALYAICAAVMLAVPQGILLVIAVMTMALLVGFAGGAVYERVALLALGISSAELPAVRAESARSQPSGVTRTLGAIVGLGGALAVVAQYLLQLQISLGGWFVVLLVACFCLLAYLMGAASQECAVIAAGKSSTGARSGAVGRKQVLVLLAAVICLWALFPFYEAVVRDAFSWIVFYQWHRLFLAVGYLAIGAAAFFGGRPAASLAIAIAAVFVVFVLAQTALLQIDNFTMALYYLLLGALIAYSGIAFMSLATQIEHRALVASAGRVLEGIVTIACTGIPLIGAWPISAVLLTALVLIALIIVLMVRGGFFTSRIGADMQEASCQAEGEAAADAEGLAAGPEGSPMGAQQLAAISERYGLTRREEEVLGLVLRGLTAQQMADELVVTKSTVKFHVTNILKKTESQTRQQLVERLAVETASYGKSISS